MSLPAHAPGRRWPLALALALALAQGCVDLGYDADPWATPDAPPPADAAPVIDSPPGTIDALACAEGVGTPSVDGPQLHFVTLNVDVAHLTISAGDVVTWTNGDTMTHTATEGVRGPPPQGFDSGSIPAGGQWAYRFCTPREIVWYCQTHSGMNGYRITVQ